MGKFIDLTGQKFTRLLVVQRIEKPDHLKDPAVYWLCKCDCGNENPTIATTKSLMKGQTKSCGCYIKDLMYVLNKKYNRYETLDGVTGIAYNLNNDDFLFTFDWEDLELIKNYGWFREYKREYIKANDLTKTNANISLHRLILSNFLGIGIKEMGSVDHADRNPSNNCKSNLRIATGSQNVANQDKSHKSKTGFTGVFAMAEKYRATIKCDGITYYLGYYDNIEDAIIARLRAEKYYFGEFAPQRHLFEQYGI